MGKGDFVVGGLAGVGATIFSNPLEVVKVRMQLQGELKKRGEHAVFYRNIPHAFVTMVKHDGVLSLQQGLVPGMCFSWIVNAVGLGLYTMAEKYNILRDKRGQTKFLHSFTFSSVAGAFSGLCGSPFQYVKTQLQSMSSQTIAVGTQHHHTGMMYAFKTIIARDGVKGLFRGAHGMMIRNGIGTASQMPVYETSKEWMKANDLFQQSKYQSAFVASNLGAIVKTAFLCPMDVIMTRLFNQAIDKSGAGEHYSGIMDCARKTAATEGLTAFYKGMGPLYVRQAPHTVLLLVFWDILKDVQKALEGKTTVI
ncbi:mitochondrial carrier protein domain-containing protein [Phthorimaea operculella]|nr:mitochondrial carrier protein domain-containing protein [Phthorimaea operculella]